MIKQRPVSSKHNLNILCVDPSFANFGMATARYNLKTNTITATDIILIQTVKSESKQIRKNSDDLRRSREIVDAFSSHYANADLVIAEVPTGTQSARAAWALGITVGILASCPKPLVEIDPISVKIKTVGNKKASKQEMIDWAYGKYPHLNWYTHKRKNKDVLAAKNEHLADAIAIGHAGIETESFKIILAMVQNILKGKKT